MIVQNQFPFGGEPKPENKSGLIIFFCVLAVSAVAGFYSYKLTSKIKKNA